jgi:hypothetical protein
MPASNDNLPQPDAPAMWLVLLTAILGLSASAIVLGSWAALQ